MFEEVLVKDHSLEHGPGRVGMLEFVGIEEAMQEQGDARKEETEDGEQYEIEGIVGAAPGILAQGIAGRRLDRPFLIGALHLGMHGRRRVYQPTPPCTGIRTTQRQVRRHPDDEPGYTAAVIEPEPKTSLPPASRGTRPAGGWR